MLKKILDAAQSIMELHVMSKALQQLFPGEDRELTDVAIYLSDEPVSGARALQIENAYSVAKALVRMGWIVFENEESLAVKLTDAGVLMARKT